MYRKLRWVVADKAKLDDLLQTLTSLNDGLFHVLPTSPGPVCQAKSQVSTLKLSFDIPFLLDVRKSSEFVGREYLIESLKQNVEEGKHTQNIIVLYGTGGMGKTQLALEYIHQYYGDYTSVFWINAASDQTTILGFTQVMQRLIQHHAELCEDYSHIGRLLGMAGKLDSNGCFEVTQPSEEQYVVDAVKRWFASLENTNWLLVFDNLDDLDSVDIEEYIPACNHGTVIITSRRRDLQQGRRGFEVQQMQSIEAIQLLLMACAMPKFEDLVLSDQTTASTIVQELGYLPLALDQAGAYIHMSQYSLGRYLKAYQSNASYLLSKGWKGGKQGRSVFATWEISFKAIQETNPEAAKLLLICGFLNNEDISEELLKRGLNLEPQDLEDAIRTLLSYSLAKRSSNDDSFSIHPLVHSWAKLRLESEPQKEIDIAREAFEVVVSGVDKSDEGRTEDWIFERRVMLHIDAITKHMAQYAEVSNMNMQDGSRSLGDVYERHGRLHEALSWYRWALAAYEKALGVDHPSTLTTAYNMASVYDNQGQYEKALEWYWRALTGQEKALGVDHPYTLTTVNNMAVVFDKQGQYEKALEWYGRALAGEEKALGVDHPDTLTTVHNMALVFDNQGQYEKALEWYGRALAGEEKVLGVDHPDTLITVNNMAGVFYNQGRYEKALEWYGRALAGHEKALGVDHPDTLITVNNMAGVFSNQGQYEKALEWYGRALAGREKVLGVDHPDTLSTVNNMALVFDNQGQYEKALEWYGRTLAGEEKVLGVDHPQTQDTIRCLISLHEKTGQTEQAQILRMRLHVPKR
ncbi:TPR-like protein [Terfezia boudieri ATCC MYA-4762]|uniref:TPR-like protein n=1 Tax=Terfezia boudieri ATCC MYA-4762 TaxID=1051890 RepID=A0A3N4LKH2_9PEZI|nr:TPR-like protein [Terfezia boudieri ATCC MYA-4762]